MIARVTKPRKVGKVEIFLPWAYRGKANRQVIVDVLGPGSHVTGGRGGVWLVGRERFADAVAGLARQPGISDVEVTWFGSGGRCVSACFDSGDSEEAVMLCECSCVGLNHGTGTPPAQSKYVGSSLVSGDVFVIPGGKRTVLYSEMYSTGLGSP